MADNRLHYETVSPLLRNVLHEMMSCEIFAPFLLVGGTALSLQLGHRVSDDIDLFTDANMDRLTFRQCNRGFGTDFRIASVIVVRLSDSELPTLSETAVRRV